MTSNRRLTRNFCIIAHVDHGKSTLADRLIERCGGVSEREMRDQILDSMEIERERGITIKAQTVRLTYGQYRLNIVDTPGHVDFSYEVSRSLRACEGALLVIDAAQGVEAQTIANAYLAVNENLQLIPVINKIDLPSADIVSARESLREGIGVPDDNAVLVSAKTGEGIGGLLDAIVEQIPPPQGDEESPLCALLIDSWYDNYVGVVTLIRVIDGQIRAKQRIRLVSSRIECTVDSVGVFTPAKMSVDELCAGDIGYILGGIRSVAQCQVGDTITDPDQPTSKMIEGFRQSLPVVFCGLYAMDKSQHNKLREALERLQLNDASLSFEPETNTALGVGFRCGCLGLLHLEVTIERLEREFGIEVLSTAPSIVYRVHLRDGSQIHVHNPSTYPDPSRIDRVQELWITATIVVSSAFVGAVMDLCQRRRGVQRSMQFVGDRCVLNYQLPLAEVVYDFNDRLKSITQGLGSMEYEMGDFKDADVVKLMILINGEVADALSLIVHRDNAEGRGRGICETLKDMIPRQMFKIPIQAAIGGKIVARETISAIRKDVTAKCYGGDITRKRKLLEKQRAGKKRMQQFGSVEVPKSAFLEVLRVNDSS